MISENPLLVVAATDRMMSQIMPKNEEFEVWAASASVPTSRLVGVWEVSHRQFLMLSVSDDGKYQIFHTIDRINHRLVHTHNTEITTMASLGYGKMVFCATDGWWMTMNSGDTWEQISLAGPVARKIAVATKASSMVLLAYCDDKKIHRCEHSWREFLEPITWEVVYDASGEVPWHPALDGGSLAVLAGAGSKLIRTTDCGDIWEKVATVDGVVKNVVSSDQSNGPRYLIEVEKDGIVRCYWTYDVGDSLAPDMNRIQPISTGRAVIPTGGSSKDTRFVVVGQKPSGERVCTVVVDDGA